MTETFTAEALPSSNRWHPDIRRLPRLLDPEDALSSGIGLNVFLAILVITVPHFSLV